jgi:FKBP-type peptidyl-prolyl cis-trans isomerase
LVRSSHESLAESNRAAAREFLARNGKLPDVHSMPSGLQYRVVSDGDPATKAPSLTDQVTVRYRASLLDGHEFDRSETHDHPATFRVGSTLKGWQEAFLAMKPGAKWQLFVPPELGYGANTPPGVPPASPVDPALMRRVPRAAEEPPAGLTQPPGKP